MGQERKAHMIPTVAQILIWWFFLFAMRSMGVKSDSAMMKPIHTQYNQVKTVRLTEVFSCLSA